MNKYIFIFLIFSVIGCTHHDDKKQLNMKEQEELRSDTKLLKSLNDSLNSTGDDQYYKKYMLKIDEMINKYPDPYRENYIKVRENMKDIFGDSIGSSIAIKKTKR